MDDLITYGVCAIALFYLIVACIVGSVLYGLYMIVTAFISGNYTPIVQPLLGVMLLLLAYGGAGILLAKLSII